MFEEALQEQLFQSGSIIPAIGFIIAFLALAGAMAFVVPAISRRMIPAPRATRLGDHIKFERMDKEGRVIIGEDDLHTVVLSIRGTDLRFNEGPQQELLKNSRENWLEMMSGLGVRVRIFMVRDRLPKATNYEHTHGIMKRVSETWAKNLPNALSTEYYAVLSHKSKNAHNTTLEEAVEHTKSILSEYHVTELVDNFEHAEAFEDGIDLDDVRYERMTPAAFFGRMLSPVSRPVPFGRDLRGNLSYAITTDNVRYDSDKSMFEFSSGSVKRYAATLVIEEWPNTMTEAYMLELLSNPVEFTVCHDILPIGKTKAMAEVAWKAKIAPGLQPGGDTHEQFLAVEAALQPGSEVEQELVSVQTLITIYGDTPEDVLKARSAVNQLRSIGITPIWPKHTMPQHWFGQFPGFDVQSRPQKILTGEAAILSTFHYNPSGELNSDWGPGPISMFQTIEGAPYSFQFHAPGGGSPPLGHCVSIGPSGAGKTTLITFLASQALRHPELKAFFFDRGRGCEVVTKSLEGAYLFFDGDSEKHPVSLNPLQIEDNGENRMFLQEWLKLIGDVKENEYELASEISDAVELIFDPQIERRNRNLQKLYTTMFPAGSALRERFTAWTNPEQYGQIVCAEEDALDISQRVGGFDFTKILEDPKLGPPMVSYLMHRILVEAKGDPRLIFIDETEPLLKNENFQRRYRKLLQEGRKERQVIISCFQRPTAPKDLGLGDVIRGQCPTVFFFRNNAADADDYADWKLTPRELDFVLGRSYKKKKYAVLVKRYGEVNESVILDTNLSGLGPYMNIYHSGRKNVQLMEQMEEDFGKGPEALKNYLAQA
jgi:type IV secretion system protein VirB4